MVTVVGSGGKALRGSEAPTMKIKSNQNQTNQVDKIAAALSEPLQMKQKVVEFNASL
jgi:hypothetical protein